MNTLRTSKCNTVNRTQNKKNIQDLSISFFHRFPKLRLLDFRKIRQKDRQAAYELFKSKKGKEILKEIAKKAKAAAANPAAAETNGSKGKTNNQSHTHTHTIIHSHQHFTILFTVDLCSAVPTASAEDVQRIRDAIKNATSLQEVERLTRILQSGNIPENLNAENGNGKIGS